ncbi:MAG: hypothetical protein R6X25_01200, partial [Candidatus Krumholzibacteriia bacterium]
MKTIGVVLVILGVLALVYGGFDYNRDRTVLKIGSAEVVATEGRSVPVPAVVGAVVLLGGLALLVTGNRRSLRT